MNQEDFDKAYFKATLQGIEGLGDLLIKLIGAEENSFAMQLFQRHNENYTEFLCNDTVSKDRCCERSPYRYCFCVPLGKNTEHMSPTALLCIWCARIYNMGANKP